MLKSMTAYGRAIFEASFGTLTIEIQSINRRHLDVILFLPREFASFDGDFRKWIAQAVSRGQVTVRISVAFKEEEGITVVPNIPFAKKLMNASKKLAESLNLPNDDHFLLTLFQQKSEELFLYAPPSSLHAEDSYKEALQKAFLLALDPFMQMKLKEGNFLLQDILDRISTLHKLIVQIKEKAPQVEANYRQKLKEKIEQLLPPLVENEERILREVVLFAEKSDITEEITRFYSHLDQLSALLTGKEYAIAKTVEFLLQELLREANTISSKSPDAEIVRHSVSIKSEIEKIREQIQNVE